MNQATENFNTSVRSNLRNAISKSDKEKCLTLVINFATIFILRMKLAAIIIKNNHSNSLVSAYFSGDGEKKKNSKKMFLDSKKKQSVIKIEKIKQTYLGKDTFLTEKASFVPVGEKKINKLFLFFQRSLAS